jgi:hypothetical protein
MILATRRRLESISDLELARMCRSLSALWVSKGCPDREDMPAMMRVEHDRLLAERERRGYQQQLF